MYDEARPEGKEAGSEDEDEEGEEDQLDDEEFHEPYWCVPCFKITNTNNMDGAKFKSTGEADYHLQTRFVSFIRRFPDLISSRAQT